jgi:hypothetical protein
MSNLSENIDALKAEMTQTPLDEYTKPGSLSEQALCEFSTKELFDSPSIRPWETETLEAWLFRISQWGKVSFGYIAPKNRSTTSITRHEFIKSFTEPELIKIFGKWDNEILDVNKLKWFRSYTGLDGKKETEAFVITVDLKPELKKAIK